MTIGKYSLVQLVTAQVITIFRKNTIRDIAVATGANVFDTEEMGLTLEKGQLFDLGEIGEVIVTKVAVTLLVHLNNKVHLG